MKIFVIFGTRPEAIKMCPVIQEINLRNDVYVKVCVTGQHKELMQQVLDVFHIIPDYDLKIMRESQTLFDISVSILNELKSILVKETPDIVLVHGDTTTAFIAALSCFYLGIPVGHVEAGLRTYNICSPYPEEFNRQSISIISKYNFAPTENAKNNLIREGKCEENIYVTGNTVIDALKTTVVEDFQHELLDWTKGKKMILMTAHRRENSGEPFLNMFEAVKDIVDNRDDVRVIYPLHLNPGVRTMAFKMLGNNSKIKLIEPLDVITFHNIMSKSYLILTDSGGIQEEAPAFGKPVMVMRDTTERPEGVEAGTLKLVGTDKDSIVKNVVKLLDDNCTYMQMSKAINPYGDGFASKRIIDYILKKGSFNE